jgi:hypothetical protein
MTQNDRISIENESPFLCSLAVISLRIPWDGHVLPGMHKEAMDKMDDVFRK